MPATAQCQSILELKPIENSLILDVYYIKYYYLFCHTGLCEGTLRGEKIIFAASFYQKSVPT